MVEGAVVEVVTTGRWAVRFWRSRVSVVGRCRVLVEGAAEVVDGGVGLGGTCTVVEEGKERVAMAARAAPVVALIPRRQKE
jgi:hypothetical protein